MALLSPTNGAKAAANHNLAPKLHLGDALTILRTLPEESVHAVITDPPYGIDGADADWDREKLKSRIKRAKVVGSMPPGMAFDPDQGPKLQAFMEPVFKECWRVLKPGGFCIAFAQARLFHRMAMAAENAEFEVRDMLGWTRNGQTKAFSQDHFVRRMDVSDEEKARIIASMGGRKTPQLMPMIEPMVLAQKPRQGTFVENWMAHGVGLVDMTQRLGGKPPGNLMAFPKPSAEERGADNDHMTVKPVALIGHLIKLFTTEDQIVLDAFMGSGSHGVAAVNTGRRFIGIERDKHYFEIAEKRIQKAIEAKQPVRLGGSGKTGCANPMGPVNFLRPPVCGWGGPIQYWRRVA